MRTSLSLAAGFALAALTSFATADHASASDYGAAPLCIGNVTARARVNVRASIGGRVVGQVAAGRAG